jgi:hypothetical protein
MQPTQNRVTQTVETNGLAPSLLDQVVATTAAHRHSSDDIHRMAITAGKSGMFKMTPDQIEILMLLCQAEGIEPVKALAMYDVYNGKPAMKSVYMLARHQASGGTYKWGETSDKAAECFFSHKTACPEGITIRWTIEQAQKAGLLSKETYRNYAEDLLVWRVVSRGVKRSNPACLFGLDVPDPLDQEPPPINPAREALVETLKSRREPANTTTLDGWKTPKESHPPVAETAREMAQTIGSEPASNPAPQASIPREADPPREPTTEVGKMIADALQGANEALAQLARENPEKKKLLKPIAINHVVRGVLKEYVERDVIERGSIQTDGKEDRQKVANVMTYLYTDDQEDLEATVAKWIGGELTKILDSLKPAVEPAQAALPMS